MNYIIVPFNGNFNVWIGPAYAGPNDVHAYVAYLARVNAKHVAFDLTANEVAELLS